MKNSIAILSAAFLAASASAANLPSSDEAFLKKAAEGGMAEVKLGELAKGKATRAEVKDFGAMMASDHSKANAELKKLAEQKGVQLPEGLQGKHEATEKKLSKLSGQEFDKAYVDEMVTDHEKDVKEFEEMSKNAKDGDVKAFAGRTLPTLRTHLEKIRAIQGKAK